MAIIGNLERKKFLRRPTVVGDIYSTTFDQEKSGPFNSIFKVLGIIPGCRGYATKCSKKSCIEA